MHYKRWKKTGDPAIAFSREVGSRPAKHQGGTTEQRFWAYVDASSECWRWTASTNPKGYGQFNVRTPSHRAVLAHRFSWELIHGPIPDHLCVLHRCDNPPCVRPDHLFLGTRGDNNADMAQKDRAKKAVCRAGHRLSGDNVLSRSNRPSRDCRECGRIRARAWHEAHRKMSATDSSGAGTA